MNLFEDEELITNDWFEVCPNAHTIILDDRKVGLFDALRLWTNDYDRLAVREALLNVKSGPRFMLDSMLATYPYDPAVMFVGRELLMKENDWISLSILALSKDGTNQRRIKFPSKLPKAVPNRLLAVFGLRPSEAEWFGPIVAIESNVMAVLPHLIEKDWEHIIHDKDTLLKKAAERDTASMNLSDWGLTQ
tara:strand:- start:9751 stop:10323 length:573 start_codon:yes stop_codon:yes gene_type:complete